MWTYGPSPFLQTRRKRVAISNSVALSWEPLYFKAIVIKWVPILILLLAASLPCSPPPRFVISGMRPVLFHLPMMVSTHRRTDFPPNYCMSPFHPSAPSLALGPFITTQPASVSLRLTPSFSGHSVRLLPVFVCCINILWAPWWRVFTAGQTAPAEPPPVSPHACSSVNPLGSPFSLNSLPFTDSLALSIAFFSSSD